MSVISSVVNFKENLSKNAPYYNLLLAQTVGNNQDIQVYEHVALGSRNRTVTSIVCEGYQFVIAFSGELYNTEELFSKLSAFGYRFIENTDAELALFSYIHYGTKSPGLLCGNFSYIIHDSMRRRIFAAVDDKASLPLFYRQDCDRILISSAPYGLFSNAVLTPQGISRLISLSGVHTGEVFYGINAILPSHFLEVSVNGVSESPYATACQSPSPEDIIEKHLKKNPQKIGVVSSGTDEDLQLLDMIFEQNCNSQVTVFSFEDNTALKNYPVLRQQLRFSEDSAFTALEYAVSTCGFPYFCGYDFLVAQLLRRNFPKNMMLFTTFGGRAPDLDKILEKNQFFHTPVKETLIPCEKTEFTPSTVQILSDACQISSAQPFYDSPIASCDFAKTQLRHILLSIIAKDTSPILAFFRSSALLRLCEGGLDIDVFECALMEYLIKLNIWLEKFHPPIL